VPFDVQTPADVPVQQAIGLPHRPKEANQGVPETLDSLIMKLLATSPEARYESATELIEELERLRDGLPPTSPSPDEATTVGLEDPPTPAVRPSAHGSTRGTRRNRSFWVLAACAALIALLGAVGWGLLPNSASDVAQNETPGESQRAAERAEPSQKKVEVPAVKGLDERQARKRLAEAGFTVQVRKKESSEEGAGRVLEQSMASGKKAQKGSKIFLNVGDGPRIARVPNLTGLTYSEAENNLQELGLPLGGVEEIPSDTVPAGVIVAQDPPPGSKLQEGAYVYLTTSLG
jgi:serine/threonine-protein kinase